MAVKRISLDACIGCGTCFKVCPMDVIRMDSEHGKSILAYKENCQTCGQCYLNCPTDSLGIEPGMFTLAYTTLR